MAFLLLINLEKNILAASSTVGKERSFNDGMTDWPIFRFECLFFLNYSFQLGTWNFIIRFSIRNLILCILLLPSYIIKNLKVNIYIYIKSWKQVNKSLNVFTRFEYSPYFRKSVGDQPQCIASYANRCIYRLSDVDRQRHVRECVWTSRALSSSPRSICRSRSEYRVAR